jgi:hypothetical protein
MSSTLATNTTDAPSSRVQSASNKEKQETPIENTSRPPSALQKTAADTSRAPVIAATGAGISPGAPAAGSDEPILLPVSSSERPPSANRLPTTDTSTELRPGSALKNASQDTFDRPSSAKIDLTLDSTTTETKTSRPASANPNTDELSSHGYSIATTNFRPPSASQNANETTTATSSRPPSASQKTNENTNATGSRPPSASPKANGTTNATGSRPPSAIQKANETTTATSSRPPSASQKVNDSMTNDSTTAAAGSRPPSASQKSNESNLNDSNNNRIDSRLSAASQNTDLTNVPESNDIPAPTNSRPPSANQKTARTGSRPPSASRQQDETTIGDSTTDQQNTSGLFNSNDPTITQPIIGRPPSNAKNRSADEPDTTTTTLDVTTSPNTLSFDENLPIETTRTTPRIGSASKNPPPSTTTENNG